MPKLTLYSYYQSSASYRVRIALLHKGIDYAYFPINIVKGAQREASYFKLNPMRQVPAILTDHGTLIAQSMAIFLWLDKTFKEKSLFPGDAAAMAQVVQFCENINSGIHPVQNLSVRKEIEKRFQATAEVQSDWSAHWIRQGFESLEETLKQTSGQFCFGDSVTAADMFLIPQVFNARRYKVELAKFPNIERIDKTCCALETFKKAHPSVQPDFPG